MVVIDDVGIYNKEESGSMDCYLMSESMFDDDEGTVAKSQRWQMARFEGLGPSQPTPA